LDWLAGESVNQWEMTTVTLAISQLRYSTK